MGKRLTLTLEEKVERRNKILTAIFLSSLTAIIVFINWMDLLLAGISFVFVYFLTYLFVYFRKILRISARIKKIETIFPDFLQLMSSNLRAGMTIDRAILSSSRPEFSPLDEEIVKAAKDIATGINIEEALLNLSQRLGSEKIHKTILLIISGIRSGGNVSILLEETAVSMREKGFIEKRSASSVLMYVIFIFLAVAIFAPALFALSTVLVDVLTSIISGLPEMDMPASSMPFSLSTVSLSIEFIMYFAIGFIIVIDVLASLVLGLVSKGEEKQGLRYLPIILLLSLGIFFILRVVLSEFIGGLL